jgi:hypothetical protein
MALDPKKTALVLIEFQVSILQWFFASAACERNIRSS